MGRKGGGSGGGGWFSTVKKVFRQSPSKGLEIERKKESRETWRCDALEVESPNLTNGESIESEDHQNHSMTVAEATTARVVRVAGYGDSQFKEERAATLIQSYYRGYLAMRALRALKGLVRLQALVRGHNVRKQVQMTMRCMQSLSRVQAHVRARRLEMTHGKVHGYTEDNEQRYNPFKYHIKNKFENEQWNTRNHDIRQARNSIFRKVHNPRMKKERALAYTFAYEQSQQQQQFLSSNENEEYIGVYNNYGTYSPQWGWNRLEQWMASQPYHSGHVVTCETTIRDNLSEKTVDMDLLMPLGSEHVEMARHSVDYIVSSPYIPRRPVASEDVPSYMAPTQSAKAKVRAHVLIKQHSPSGPQWNSSTKRGSPIGLGYESSSSGGGTIAYQAQRSPITKANLHGPPKWMCSPESSSEDRAWASRAYGGWKNNFA